MHLGLRKLDYKWVALSNTTLGMLIATINGSILLIALPDIFRGIGIDPLAPGNTSYLLWLILGFLVVMAVLRRQPRPARRHLRPRADVQPRLRRLHRSSRSCSRSRGCTGSAGALWLILMRVGQGVGGALLFANSSAILTDAFPHDQRGLALGVNSDRGDRRARSSGSCSAACSRRSTWRLVFLVSVPIGVFATVWSYHSLRELGVRRPARIDWWGNAHASRSAWSR